MNILLFYICTYFHLLIYLSIYIYTNVWMLGFWLLLYVCHFMSCHWYIYLHFKKYEIIINIPLERGTHVVLDSGDIFLSITLVQQISLKDT